MRVNKDNWFWRNVEDRRGKKCLTDVTILEILTKIWRAQMFPIKQLKSLPVQDLQLSIHNVRTHAICVAVRYFSHRVLLFLNFSILFSLSLLLRNPISQTITNVTLFDFVDEAENLQETISFFLPVISHVPHKGPLLICYWDAVKRLLPESGLEFQM